MKKFKKVYIEITNICNLECDFCPKTQREEKYMGLDEFSRAIDAIRPLTQHVYFHLMGEPFLHPNLKECLDICHSKSIKVNITTNGTLIKQVSEVLVNASALRKVSFSLHSMESSQGGLNEYIDDIVKFIEKANGNLIIELRLWNLIDKDENSLNEPIIRRLEKGLGIKISERSENTKINTNLYLSFASRFEWPDLSNADQNDAVFCYGLRDQFGVLVDGTVVPCCLDNDGQISLGNIFEKPIEEILLSERARKIYEGFSKRIPSEEICKKCDYAKKIRIREKK